MMGTAAAVALAIVEGHSIPQVRAVLIIFLMLRADAAAAAVAQGHAIAVRNQQMTPGLVGYTEVAAEALAAILWQADGVQ
jgi:hypothetical protein